MKPSIATVLEHYGWDGNTTGYGEWQNTKCPFHGDRRASGRVNLEEQVFHCLACPMSGDAYDLVEQREGVDFTEAKRRVQEITGRSSDGLSDGPERSLWEKRSLLPKRKGNRPGDGEAVPPRGGGRLFR